ncbi:endonuclease/exonuclease/phosphatase family protein [Veronia pacifica]|uniref:Endonuclease/exonuclease/phosphatase domain-containing protein n=2 Tax=Veronia pacifica TaxID=1080227 RepID=A0A1C3EPY2_9GAMM|nr:endonuclease/exonuclease/phosphatase family protein [Veronia pacifica]ODA35308.1 hypothetical protein A8L45_03830 [Veronia pacifica]
MRSANFYIIASLLSATAYAEDLEIVTWNLGSEDNCRVKTDLEHAVYSQYAREINADVYVLQQVSSIQSLDRIFSGLHYDFIVSKPNTNTRCNSIKGSPARLAFAIKKGIKYRYTKQEDLIKTTLTKTLQYGITLDLPQIDLKMLNIELPKGCFQGSLTQKNRDCRKMRTQLPLLKNWLNRYPDNQKLLVLGEFNRWMEQASDMTVEYLGTELYHATGDLSPCHNRNKGLLDHILLSPAATATLALPGAHFYQLSDVTFPIKTPKRCPIGITLASAGH